MKIIAIGIAIILAVGSIASIVRGRPKAIPAEKDLFSAIPLASSPYASWPKLVIPAGGRSERMEIPSGMHHVDVYGDKYRLHTVYADGSECATFGKETCPDGAAVSIYVSNDASTPNTVAYAFAPRR